MNKIYQQFDLNYLECFCQRTFYLAILLINLLFSHQIRADQIECINDALKNNYYLIESEDYFNVPLFFQKLNELSLEKYNMGLSHRIGQRHRLVQYFDYPERQLLKENKELVLILNQHLPEYRKDRYDIYFRDNNKKIPKELHIKQKTYNKKMSSMDKHIFFSHVRRKDRLALKALVKIKNHKRIEDLSPVLDINKEEVVFLLSHYGKAKFEISLENFYIINYELEKNFMLIKFEFQNEFRKALHEDEIIQIKKIVCLINNKFKQQFKHVSELSQPGYKYYNSLANKILPSRQWIKDKPMFYKLGQTVILSLIGFLLIYFVVGRYNKQTHIKVLINSRKNK